MTVKIFTKPRADYERNLTPTRFLAARFYIYCLEGAIGKGAFPRGHSLSAIELEFRPMRPFGKDVRYTRAPLAERLGRIYGRIVFGRKNKEHELAAGVAVEEWMQRPEIKAVLAERALTGDA